MVCIVSTIAFAVIVILPVPVLETKCFSTNCNSKDDQTVFFLRVTQSITYSLLTVVTLLTSGRLMYLLKTRMFLYYVDFRNKLLINICGVLAFMILQTVHVVKPLVIKGDLTSFEQDFVYFMLQLVSCAILSLARITDDLFVQLNRERTLLRISVFQYDLSRLIDYKLLAHVNSQGDARQLRDELDNALLLQNRPMSA